ncbi:hypothetical protein [Croceitalea rosinachiae]|uniref:Uncharacterized protein n=1 Tax=Croceitalea rosinachiae TaxID=3075596 RepID=A0ABU3A9J6_9FLAO|nr:hypothetical protein [Croceitalea sp. F388]MDT0606866.1 hypothetical protein [Croceitalea sp. F388]
MELKLGYIGLSILMTIILVVIANKATKSSASKAPAKLLYILLGWHLYIYLLSITGFLENLDFPPRFVFLTIMPAFIFVGWFAKKAKNSQWLLSIPSHWLVFYQFFRILIETLFVFTVSAGLLHVNVTIEGYNFDMIYAITALAAGWLVMKGYYKFGLIWNYLGLLVIASIIILFQLTIFAPHVFGPNTASFPLGFLQYPYMLVPAFLMPSAVFIHVLSIVQLRKKLT